MRVPVFSSSQTSFLPTVQAPGHGPHLSGAAAERGGPSDLLRADGGRPTGLHLPDGPGGHCLPQHETGRPGRRVLQTAQRS